MIDNSQVHDIHYKPDTLGKYIQDNKVSEYWWHYYKSLI